ncbi:hypothetical protein PLCT2_00170 [Planctomycetaceae bacterium]|nr:hypothetical protein PLCT2_00170 [Planctomycetaceae bacterium]
MVVHEREQLVTADDLLNLKDSKFLELVEGRIIPVTPSGDEAGELALWIGYLLMGFVMTNDLGTVAGADTGFRIARNPDTVRSPDVSFITKARLRPHTGKFFEGAPDLAVEVISPSNTSTEMQEKIDQFFAPGARLIWLVYPGQRLVVVHYPGGTSKTFREDMTLEGGEVLPGFSLPVHEVFKRLRKAPTPTAPPSTESKPE